MAIPTYARLTPDLRPTYARAAAPGTDCPGPSQSHLGPTWPALGRGKLVVVLMAYATTYAQLTPAYANLRHHTSNQDFRRLLIKVIDRGFF